ncbi:MAG: tRNA (guanosine(37)-N1)-methyltransferase TrmD [Deltaproteobacteria bacterium]|nr:tRNA (guanosine(37)-N1)-methyltransferase TrmD [Deltaproteobacteria bacterium]MBW1927633.1 tRNA (guanosine(37)-N1)-methyltransferase TrmD [Deltaproteobacteria bacterium]MBW2025586.1 tRNA (guanosine(37)-N1)-methyltransferase TrmD [Deltaproteobacteria bacterium]MBW2126196.1 tRNA (guanosine(37)-N1)-methyltransferase TrmD [Deltaproteobacteria bacterium]RLB23274.1 MAG: tRNA (guanosine(37)-N1)-methyltransferase TrmD [Deltaproteobacteria bacterium]
MRFDVLTIFPEIFLSGYLSSGILGKAITKGLLKVRVVNIRDFADDPHKSTDDRPYGGGEGMVMKPEPIFKALECVDRDEGKSLTILLSPQGERFHQGLAWELCGYNQLVLVCGRYEGVDERVKELCIDREISIGDYVLTGGELPALVLMDAVARLIPGVLGNDWSAREDSFQNGLLEYPHYTRPRVFQGREVPEVLLSGDHERIRNWRRRQALKRTLERRPDLLESAALTAEDKAILRELKAEKASMDEES